MFASVRRCFTRLFPLAWINLADWQRAQNQLCWRQRRRTLYALGLLNFACTLIVSLPLFLQLFAKDLDQTQLKVKQWYQTRQSVLSQATQTQEAALRNQRQVQHLSQLVSLEENSLSGFRLKQARWTASQLSLFGDYTNTEMLAHLVESLRIEGQQSVQLQLQPQRRAQLDVFKP